MVALVAVLLLAAWRYISVSGVLRKYPEPEYLTDAEAEKRPV